MKFDNKNVIIFGTSVSTERFLYQNRENINVKYFLDNKISANSKKRLFMGKEVLKPQVFNITELKKYLIVVCSGDKSYIQIKEQLQALGLKEFENFISMKIYNRHPAVFLGNCNMLITKEFLEKTDSFTKKYGICQINPIQELEYTDLEEALKYCDLFIRQDIRKENKYSEEFSSRNTDKLIGKDCKVLTIPDLHLLAKMVHPEWCDRSEGGERLLYLFGYPDGNIERWKQEGKSDEMVLHKLLKEEIYSEKEVKENFQFYMSRLQEREKNCDMIISDYILNSYKKVKLFYDIGHPTNEPLIELGKRILEKLNLPENQEDIILNVDLELYETPIYKDVAKYLGMEFDTEAVRKKSTMKLCDTPLSREEYFRQYLYLYMQTKKE